jgi:ring-1,2-phenylacetyl-CoA epoxidase subunit PaaE
MQDPIDLLVNNVIRETDDAVTLVLENPEGRIIDYKAGQFLTFIFNIHGKEIRRSYSLSSAPGIDNDLAVTVKRVQNGEISRYVFDNISRGSILKSLLPAGRFTIQSTHTRSRDIFLFGAGSGIVPLFSILKKVLLAEPDSHIHLIYSNHNESTIIFRKQLANLEQVYKDRFHCVHLLSNPSSKGSDIIHGHLNNILVEELLQTYLRYEKSQSVFYICGPFAYMRMIGITLPVLGISHEQIYREIFLADINASKPSIPWPNIDATVEILIADKKYAISVPAGKTILKAALENGVRLPYSCEAGICSTCTAYRLEGEVEMSVNEVLTENDLAKGLVLTCTGYPVTSHVTIRY